eukprot:9763125-Alexandrium_andersonii.AAC.1
MEVADEELAAAGTSKPNDQSADPLQQPGLDPWSAAAPRGTFAHPPSQLKPPTDSGQRTLQFSKELLGETRANEICMNKARENSLRDMGGKGMGKVPPQGANSSPSTHWIGNEGSSTQCDPG